MHSVRSGLKLNAKSETKIELQLGLSPSIKLSSELPASLLKRFRPKPYHIVFLRNYYVRGFLPIQICSRRSTGYFLKSASWCRGFPKNGRCDQQGVVRDHESAALLLSVGLECCFRHRLTQYPIYLITPLSQYEQNSFAAPEKGLSGNPGSPALNPTDSEPFSRRACKRKSRAGPTEASSSL